MKIAIDIRCLTGRYYSGISVYTLNLLNEIFKIDSKNQYFLFYNKSKPVKLPKFDFLNVNIVNFHYPNKLFNLSSRYLNYPKIDRMIGSVDIFWLPNFNFISLSAKCRKLITIHDLSFVRYPDFFSFRAKLWHYLVNPKKLCRDFDYIIAVSENTKNDLIDLYQIPLKKIKVIYPGVDNQFKIINEESILTAVKDKYLLPEKFILFLGNLEPRKNIESLIEAYKQLNSDYYLVIVGAKVWQTEKIDKLTADSTKKIKIIGYIESQDQPAIYNLAKLFVYPSFYEGFGFPPLEAMACGTPTIISSVSSLPEIAGDAALMVDPNDINSLTEIMRQVLENNLLQKKLISQGLNQANKFSWQKTAKDILNFFNEINH